MNIHGKIGSFAIAISQVNGKYSPNRTFKTAVLGMFILAGGAMTAIFLYHGVKSPMTPAEYLIYAGGMAALAGGGGLGAWLHSNAKPDT